MQNKQPEFAVTVVTGCAVQRRVLYIYDSGKNVITKY
jgi:formylmethanofuran dehydrogenase subunit E